jgi:protease IV
MKNFFSSFLGALTALIVFFIGGFLVMIIGFAGIAAATGDKIVTVTKDSYLVLDLSGALQDTPDQAEGLGELMEALGAAGGRKLQLRQVTRALEAAAADPEIAGVFLRGNLATGGYSSGYAALKEVREALETFKKSGKPIKAYLNYVALRDYYVQSVADDVVLDPYGAIFIPGLASQPTFFTGAFEKFGVGVQVTRVGKYKSAIEPYTMKEMSPENRQQTQKLLDDVWSNLAADIEAARGLEAGTLQRIVDTEGLIRPESAKQHRLVNRIAYWDEVLDELKAATGRRGSKQTFKQIALKDYAKLVSNDGVAAKRRGDGKITVAGGDRVAIVYAEGTIVDGTGGEEGYVYGEKLAKQIRELRLDDKVKAIVLRVNSPGGSASASEAIQRELRLANADKPVVVSMGTVAASGGYWISTYSDRIYAEPTTITGSIGVFGMFMNFERLAEEKLGLTFDTVKTGKFADVLSVVRPKTEDELAIIQGYVDWIYDEFTSKVSEARKLDKPAVLEIAQGRVWSGMEARKLGLVDEIGGLADAVKFAAEKAGLGESFRVAEYPRRKPFAEALSEAFDPKKREQAAGLKAGAVGRFVAGTIADLQALAQFNDPRGVYARMPFDLKLD